MSAQKLDGQQFGIQTAFRIRNPDASVDHFAVIVYNKIGLG